MSDPIWSPGPVRRQTANIRRFLELARTELDPGIHEYQDLHRYSIENPTEFWRAVWEFCEIVGYAGNEVIIDADQMPGAKWFPGARLNFAENLLRFRDEQTAILFKSETGDKAELTYKELYTAVAQTASALKAAGVETGDRVAAYMPNLPETVIAMLAATSLGAIWSSCSPDFGIDGVVDRLGQIQPRVMFCSAAYSYNGKTHDCLDKVKHIVNAIPSIEKTIVVPYVNPDAKLKKIRSAVWLDEFIDKDVTEIDFVRLPFDHPVYIMYSSGTTGVPKCITHGAGGTLILDDVELAREQPGGWRHHGAV